MEDSAKYLIHADVTADGVVERSDVVGAVFGQTEGLLGTEMDLRKLQEASKVGRIDVDVESEGGRSFGEITIASSLDKVETSVLAAALETISRVGPCRAEVRITNIEDVRAAKRKEVVDRAKELMTQSFDDSVLTTQEILEEVRRSVRVEDITEYEGLPAGPHVEDSDAIIVVEGRADVLQLLQYGIKNAIAVEGTNVPEAVGDLTEDRTVTAFFDGDRGGDLILKELAQVGSVDYVALAPPGRSVEELSRHEVTSALRDKMPYEVVADAEQGIAATDGSVHPAPSEADGPANPSPGPDAGPSVADAAGSTGTDETGDATQAGDPSADAAAADGAPDGSPAGGSTPDGTVTSGSNPDGSAESGSGAAGSAGSSVSDAADAAATSDTAGGAATTDGVDEPDAVDDGASDAGTDDGDPTADPAPSTLAGHVSEVDGAGTVRLLDESLGVLAEADAADAFDAIEGTDGSPWAVVLDGELNQRHLDVAAQRGVAQVVARETGDFVKRPASVRIRTVEGLLGD